MILNKAMNAETALHESFGALRSMIVSCEEFGRQRFDRVPVDPTEADVDRQDIAVVCGFLTSIDSLASAAYFGRYTLTRRELDLVLPVLELIHGATSHLLDRLEALSMDDVKAPDGWCALLDVVVALQFAARTAQAIWDPRHVATDEAA